MTPEHPGPPDFVGVGAQRSGTSWWFSLLLQHPGVAAGRKELHYFDRFGGDDFGAAEVAGYHEKFPPPGELQRGEWTPRYMHDFWAPALLARAAPEANLLAILRDPVERYRSAVRFGRDLHERRPRRSGPMFAGDALERGRYHRQLRRLLDYFPRERLLVLQYERCVAEPLPCYARTLSFLGLPGFEPGAEAIGGRVGWSTEREPLPARIHERLVADLGEDVELLAAGFPEIDLGLWPSFSPRA